MKKLKNILNEIGDRPMKISKFNISSDGVLRARAIDKDLNITLDVLIDEAFNEPEGYYIITFYVNESTDKTGTGHEIKVFSTVKAIMDRWFNEWKDWSTIEFSASKDGSYEDNTGRERLYTRYAKMVANKHGAKLELKKKSGYTVYFIRKNISESNEFQLNEIGDRPMKIAEFDLNKKTGELFAFASTDDIDLELSIDRLTAQFKFKGQPPVITHEINFLVNHEHEKTGEGNEILIFSTVKAMVERWLKEYTGWQRIMFAGGKDGSEKKNTGRERLYKRFAGQIAKKYGGKLDLKKKTNETVYVISRRLAESNEFQLNELLTMVNPEEWVDIQLRDKSSSMKNWTRERFIKVTNNMAMRKYISSFGFKATRELADEVMSIRDKKLKP